MQTPIWRQAYGPRYMRSALAMAVALSLTACGSGEEEDDGKSDSNFKAEPTLVASIKSQSINEGSGGPREHDIQVSLSGSPRNQVTVDYRVSAGTATSGSDFTIESEGKITFAPGIRRVGIPVTINGDTLDEPDETFTVELTGMSGGELSDTENEAAFTLVDDDNPPSAYFTSRQQSVNEAIPETLVEVQLSTASGRDVTVPYSVSGTARRDSDYSVPSEQSVTIPAGHTGRDIEVTIQQDTVPEGGETIVLQLDEPTNATLSADQKELSHVVVIAGEVGLNDTGFNTFSDGTSTNLSSEPAAFPGQDGSRGRDVTEPSSTDGVLGFSFTKIDASGNPLPASAPAWSCVRDNVTGLVWENKVNDNLHWRDSDHVYTWFSDDNTRNGGSQGATNVQLDPNEPYSADCRYRYEPELRRPHRLYCNTETYQDEMNWYGVCGFKDWRLPEVAELRSLYRYSGQSSTVAPDVNFFNPHSANYYYSSTPSADNDASIWCMGTDGDVRLCHKGGRNAIRLVRKGE